MTKPLFSVITVTLNNMSGLQKTCASLQNQTRKDFEHIIIDGGSTDGTQDYLKSLNVQIISEKDNGIYDAMNKGIDRTQGQYFIFMNAGDCFANEQTLLSIQDAIEKNNPDFIYGDALEDNTHYKKARDHKKMKHGMITHHQAMIYKAALIGNTRYSTHYNIAADYDFTLKIINKANIISYIPEPLCLFESDGLSQKNVTQGRKEQFIIRRAHNFSLWQSSFIFVMQSVLYGFRKIMPRFYWFLKRY